MSICYLDIVGDRELEKEFILNFYYHKMMGRFYEGRQEIESVIPVKIVPQRI